MRKMDCLFKGKDGVCIRWGKKNRSTKTAFVEWNEKEAKIFFFFPGVKVELMEKMQMNLTIHASLLIN